MMMKTLLVGALACATSTAAAAQRVPDAPQRPSLPTTSTDKEPPVIEDLAVAAQNPAASAVVTALLSDETGVAKAMFFYRTLPAAPDEKYQALELDGDRRGLFMAKLPDGPQRTGFEYYVEVTDMAGNPPTRLGSVGRPFVVDRAVEATRERAARQKALEPQKMGPGWAALALGVGALTGAGSAGSWTLYGVQRGRDSQIVTELDDPSTTAATRATLHEEQQSATNTRVLAFAGGTALGVAAVTGLTVGVILLVAAANEE